MLNFNDTPDFVVELEKLANFFEARKYELYTFLEDEIWQLARQSEKIPNFENIYISEVFSRLESVLDERYKELDLHFYADVNSISSSLIVGNTEVKDIESRFKKL